MTLVTRAEWEQLTPLARGYIAYMQSELPGSELKGVTNPYAPGTRAHDAYNEGEQRGVLTAQDSEE